MAAQSENSVQRDFRKSTWNKKREDDMSPPLQWKLELYAQRSDSFSDLELALPAILVPTTSVSGAKSLSWLFGDCVNKNKLGSWSKRKYGIILKM